MLLSLCQHGAEWNEWRTGSAYQKIPRKPGKCRPVRLTIESIERKKNVLEAARTKVRNSDSALVRNVYFHSDLTKTQRNEAYERRERKRLLKAEQENQHRKERDKDRLGDRTESIHGSQ